MSPFSNAPNDVIQHITGFLGGADRAQLQASSRGMRANVQALEQVDPVMARARAAQRMGGALNAINGMRMTNGALHWLRYTGRSGPLGY